jgi:hypothetical protein
MIPLGHIAGVPVEELLPTIAGPAAGLAMVRVWLNLRLRRPSKRHREPEE